MTVRPCRIVILTADTGGGHRSASEALAEALGDAGQTNVVVQDVFRYVPWPLNQVPQWYLPAITYAAKFWGGIYKLSDQAAVARLFARGLIGPVTRRGLARLFQKLSPDLVISAHPLFQHEAVKVLRRVSPAAAFVTLVTDLASAHRLWFTPLADLCLLPTQDLLSVALGCGVPGERIHITGLPVHRAFAVNRLLERADVRRSLGLQERPTALLVGGGEGMGNLMALAEVVQQSVPHLQLLVVAGRNEALRQRMLERTWQGAVHIYGFVRNMPQLMRAADVIITKAGPSTLSEALVCGLPIVISGYVPGQEEGNVRYIVNHQAGYFLSNPATELGALLASRFADDGEGMAATTLNASALGRPDAAREAARLVLGLCPKIDAGGD